MEADLLSRHTRKHNGRINVMNAGYASFRGMWDIRWNGGRHLNECREYLAVDTCLQLETTSTSFEIATDQVYCVYNATVKRET